MRQLRLLAFGLLICALQIEALWAQESTPRVGILTRLWQLERASKFEFVVSRNTANQLGVTVPDTLMVSADKVIN